MKQMQVIFFRLIFCGVLFIGMLATGCADPVMGIINHGNRQAAESATERGKTLLEEHLKLIEKLRSEGDPMGDYLWAEANEHGLVPNAIQDPEQLNALYEKAAVKGSVDAQNKVALLTFLQGAAWGGTYNSISAAEKAEKEIVWRKGLEMLEASTAQQCYYWGVIMDGMANRWCMKPVTAADTVWPKFRDGFAYPKDQALREYWAKRGATCDLYLNGQGPEFFYNRKFPACR